MYLSPVAIVGLFWAAIGALGHAFRDELVNSGGAGIALEITDEVAFRALVLVSTSATVVIVAGAVGLKIAGAVRRGALPRPGRLTERTSPPAHPALALVAALPLVAFVAEVGIGDFIERDYYIVGERGSFVASVVMQLATLVIVLLGYMLACRRPAMVASAATSWPSTPRPGKRQAQCRFA